MLALNRNPSQNQFLIDVSHKITTFAVPNLTLGLHMHPIWTQNRRFWSLYETQKGTKNSQKKDL